MGGQRFCFLSVHVGMHVPPFANHARHADTVCEGSKAQVIRNRIFGCQHAMIFGTFQWRCAWWRLPSIRLCDFVRGNDSCGAYDADGPSSCATSQQASNTEEQIIWLTVRARRSIERRKHKHFYLRYPHLRCIHLDFDTKRG